MFVAISPNVSTSSFAFSSPRSLDTMEACMQSSGENRKYVIIGTAGHVDHGKTTLIRALTGTDTDRLSEEKARGMTIDLGFATLLLPGDPPIEAGIVDVPGHERFVKNMLSGAGGVDVALVVVAADEGPMPQTREHLDILQTLGIARGVVALTKTDRADAELVEIAGLTVREALEGSLLADIPIVPVSAETGEGLDALRAALAVAAGSVPPVRPGEQFRVPVDRVFTLPGVGTVVTGTLSGGRLTAGEAITVQPQGIATRARTLQTHGQKIDAAVPGQRVAINLPGVEVGQIERGAVLAPTGALAATTLVDVYLSLLPTAPRPLKHGERIRLYLGAGRNAGADSPAQRNGHRTGRDERRRPTNLRIARRADTRRAIRSTDLQPGALRRWRNHFGPKACPPHSARAYRWPLRRRNYSRRAPTRRRAASIATPPRRVYAALATRHEDRSADELAGASGVDRAAVDAALGALAEAARAFRLPDGRFLSDLAAKRVTDTARRVLDAYHRQNPLRKAMPRDDLRAPLAKAATIRDYAAALGFLREQGVLVTEGIGIRLPTHEVTGADRLAQTRRRYSRRLRRGGISAARARQLSGELPPRHQRPRDLEHPDRKTTNSSISADDLYLHRDALARVRALLPQLAATSEGITVGSLRDATGSSRKVILPLLEYLDAQKWTIRAGDKTDSARIESYRETSPHALPCPFSPFRVMATDVVIETGVMTKSRPIGVPLIPIDASIAERCDDNGWYSQCNLDPRYRRSGNHGPHDSFVALSQ